MRDKNPVIMGLIGALLLSTPAVAATADDFTDFPSDWSAPALSQAVENGLLNGYDGKINPTGLLTRAQMATMVNREWGQMGQNYLRSLFALGFQAFLIMVCVGIYAVLVQDISVEDDVSTALWTCIGYTVLLCFTLFKSSSVAKSIFNAHG